MPGRTFVVTVSEAPSRVVVEDVRTGHRAMAHDLAGTGEQIARLLQADGSTTPVENTLP